MNIHFKITNITCDACLKVSDVVLRGLPGVTGLTIQKDGTTNLETEHELSWEDITAALTSVDKQAVLI